jgi:hypothetical protein
VAGAGARSAAACNRSGFSGRTGVYELLVIDDELRSCIHRNAPESEMRQSAAKSGMVTMRDDGQRWVQAASLPWTKSSASRATDAGISLRGRHRGGRDRQRCARCRIGPSRPQSAARARPGSARGHSGQRHCGREPADAGRAAAHQRADAGHPPARQPAGGPAAAGTGARRCCRTVRDRFAAVRSEVVSGQTFSRAIRAIFPRSTARWWPPAKRPATWRR